ncbi:hypothetical protein RND71_031785 [Anisodus tanguticus]|uniref:Uncharacterized protein n=1 Tax=Anisodus tanguticus TaxID=243964 RepID=A0AAE1V5Z0_9SOLA|nr:hypothetical protein RND71_031785 [Anisodus tanguticus]
MATELPLSSPSASPASMMFQIKEEEQLNDNNYASIQEEQLNKFKEVESQFQTEQEFQDYGFWDPAPYFGGGDPAPIPHGRGHIPKEQKAKGAAML